MPVNEGDILEVTARVEFDGVDDIVNVFHFEQGLPGSVNTQDAIDDILTVMDNLYQIFTAFQTLLMLYRDIRIANRTRGELLGVHGWPTMTTGSAIEDALPPGVAGIINFYGDEPRRVMRKYIGGFTEASVEADGTWDLTTVGAMSLFGAALLVPQVQPSSTWHYVHESGNPLLGVMFPISMVTHNIPGYQRRRKQGRGS